MTNKKDDDETLSRRIKECLSKAQKIQTAAFRSVSLRYANAQNILSGQGASINGGRWNPVGTQAIYASLSPVTATHESYAGFNRYGFQDREIKTRAFVGINVDIQLAIDLTDKSILRALKVSMRQLLAEDWQANQNAGRTSKSQMFGAAAKTAGLEGLLVPSAKHPTGKNLVVFPDNLKNKSSISVMDPTDLPPHPKHWPDPDSSGTAFLRGQ